MNAIDTLVRERIKKFREFKGLRQADLAERLGISAKQVNVYERGRAGIDLELVERIARALEIQAIDLLYPKETPEPVRVEVKVPVEVKVEIPVEKPMSPESAINVLEDAVKKLRHLEKASGGCDLSHLGEIGEEILKLLPALKITHAEQLLGYLRAIHEVATESASIDAAKKCV